MAEGLITQVSRVLDKLAGGAGWSIEMCDGTVEIIRAPLPGRLIASLARQRRTLWVIVDLDKPSARDHLMFIMAGWRMRPENRWAATADPTIARWHTLDDVVRLWTTTGPGRCTIDAGYDEVAV